MSALPDGRPSVFLGPLEISGYYGNLERGLVELGLTARLVTMHPHPFGFEQAQDNPWPARFAVWTVLAHRRLPAPLRPISGTLYVIASILLLLWTLPRFDSYIFSWGDSLLPRNADLPLLRLLRKNVTVVLGHGSEARPPYMSTPPEGAPPFTPAMLSRLRAQTHTIARKVRRIERWATHVIGLPTTAQFLSQPFINFYSVGLPISPDLSPVEEPSDTTVQEIVVLHVPSKPEVKGSVFIRECMEKIVASHPSVRYVELSGRPHSEILDAISRATFVIDQLWSDIPMAIVGAEAASFGKATVIAGYAWEVWDRSLAPEDWPPTVVATPETLLDTLERCVDDAQSMRELGARAREFVASRWSNAEVARHHARILASDIPSEWIISPSDVDYGYGCGVSKERVDEMVRALVSEYGTGSLEWKGATKAYGLMNR